MFLFLVVWQEFLKFFTLLPVALIYKIFDSRIGTESIIKKESFTTEKQLRRQYFIFVALSSHR